MRDDSTLALHSMKAVHRSLSQVSHHQTFMFPVWRACHVIVLQDQGRWQVVVAGKIKTIKFRAFAELEIVVESSFSFSPTHGPHYQSSEWSVDGITITNHFGVIATLSARGCDILLALQIKYRKSIVITIPLLNPKVTQFQ